MGGALLGKMGGLSILAGAQNGLSDEDARILRGLRAGIEDAYEELIKRYQQPVYAIVYRLLGNQSDACDVTQDVFIKIFRGVSSFHERSSLRTWMYRIAINEARNYRRWFVRHKGHELPMENGDFERFAMFAADRGRSPFDEAAERENRTLIEQALSRINPVFRIAVVLRDIENLSYEEISEVLQVSIGTVKSRILRGREALRKELAHHLEPGLAEVFS